MEKLCNQALKIFYELKSFVGIRCGKFPPKNIKIFYTNISDIKKSDNQTA
jgi:hypothetical protein